MEVIVGGFGYIVIGGWEGRGGDGGVGGWVVASGEVFIYYVGNEVFLFRGIFFGEVVVVRLLAEEKGGMFYGAL